MTRTSKPINILLLLGLGFAATSLARAGQLTFTFNNWTAGTVKAPIYYLEPADPTVRKTGNTPTGYPSGTQSYGGTLLPGQLFSAQVFVGSPGMPEADFFPLAPATPFRTDAPGFVLPSNISVPWTDPGPFIQFQVRAWYNRSNTVSSWSQVLADPTVPRGSSGIWLYQVPTSGGPYPPPASVNPMAYLRSFNLYLPSHCDCSLSYYRTNGQVVITWPGCCGDCVLETTTVWGDPTHPTVWTPVYPPPTGNRYVTPADEPTRFYRLHCPE